MEATITAPFAVVVGIATEAHGQHKALTVATETRTKFS